MANSPLFLASPGWDFYRQFFNDPRSLVAAIQNDVVRSASGRPLATGEEDSVHGGLDPKSEKRRKLGSGYRSEYTTYRDEDPQTSGLQEEEEPLDNLLDDPAPKVEDPLAGPDFSSSCHPQEPLYSGGIPHPNQEPCTIKMEEPMKQEEPAAPQTQGQVQAEPEVMEEEEEIPGVFQAVENKVFENHFKVPQQTHKKVTDYVVGSRDWPAKISLPEYTRKDGSGERFLCLFQNGLPYYVSKDQLQLRLMWTPVCARLTSGGTLPMTDLEKAYEADRAFCGKLPPRPEACQTPAPLQVYDSSGDRMPIPTAWINGRNPPATIDWKTGNPLRWWIRQCLKWASLLRAVAAGKTDVSAPGTFDMYFRYRPNKPLEKVQAYISFASCLEEKFEADDIKPSKWIKDQFLTEIDPKGVLQIAAVDSYHTLRSNEDYLEVNKTRYTLWSNHPRDFYRTWIQQSDITALSSVDDYRTYGDLEAEKIYPAVKNVLKDPPSTLRGSAGRTLTCVSAPKYSSAGKREGDQSSKMNGVSATVVAEAIYKGIDAQRTQWRNVAEWLHRSGFQMGGFGVEVFFHDPQSSQNRFNLVFGTKNANTDMLRYETWARRFTANWYENQYLRKPERPNYAAKAFKYGLSMGDPNQYKAIYEPIPEDRKKQKALQTKLVALHQKHRQNGITSMDKEAFAKLDLGEERAMIRKWGIKAQQKGDWITGTTSDRHAFQWICQARDEDTVHSHLETAPTPASIQFVMDLYRKWYADVAKAKRETKEEHGWTGTNFWPTASLDEITDAKVKAYHNYQAFARFGWIMPELQWTFSAPWTDRTGQTQQVVVDKTFKLFSKRLPFQFEAKLDGAVDELWYQMMAYETDE
ncbi:hypothetical protein NliqN6_1528 [Naganishia liquefaciens]|uniref:Uncharacterized protein n=1 Tax=Naganishia liquefaciens TaxID=104408 RepID=A0A8H3TPT5_9TREE|nr:hypothetical protein NliqN6_1528 [Naganishia liquefaciens]